MKRTGRRITAVTATDTAVTALSVMIWTILKVTTTVTVTVTIDSSNDTAMLSLIGTISTVPTMMDIEILTVITLSLTVPAIIIGMCMKVSLI